MSDVKTMKMKFAKPFLFASVTVFVFSFILFLSACSKNDTKGGMSHLELRLTDGPSNVDKVNIDIQSIEIHASGDTSANSGWQDLHILHPGVYNLLDFRNGMDTLLASIDLPAGKISQIRLKLGNNNSIVVNGQTFALTTPSGQQSGLKFNLHQDLVAGVTYKIWIDFDAARSVVQTGNGKYSLKPVIRTFSEATSGAIKGVVVPKEAKAFVLAVSGTDSLSAIPDSIGRYFFKGVKPGSWTLTFDADSTTGYIDQQRPGINVTLGNVTVVDTVKLVK